MSFGNVYIDIYIREYIFICVYVCIYVFPYIKSSNLYILYIFMYI